MVRASHLGQGALVMILCATHVATRRTYFAYRRRSRVVYAVMPASFDAGPTGPGRLNVEPASVPSEIRRAARGELDTLGPRALYGRNERNGE